jgi:TRAP-type C4-dicarboxylate transport system substrate-binding protein
MVAFPPASRAQTIVKLATLAPDGSIWHRVLTEQAVEWKRLSNGRVELRIYPGGVAGDDPDMVRKMRVGQLQAAALSVEGLAEIDEAFRLFQTPLFFDSPDELWHVLDRLEPVLRPRLEAKGFVLLNWGYGGWVYLYSKRPIDDLGDLRAQKLFMWSGDERGMRIWRSHGLQPVALAATDIMMALQTGMIEALATTPLAALSLQWYRLVPYQLDAGLAPLIGATVMTQRGFQALPEQDREALRGASARADQRFRKEVPEQEQRALVEMRERRLTVTSIAPAGQAEWESNARSLAETYGADVVPADVFDLARRLRNEYRQGGGGTRSP